MNKLFLITKEFPYGRDTGEMYLRYEIFEICKVFDEVNIIACGAKAIDDKAVDILPKNVKVISLSISNNKIKSLFKMIYIFFSKKDEFVEEEWKNTKGFLKKLFLLYFLAKSEKEVKTFLKHNALEKINNDDSVVIYSYRLFDLAYVAIKIKETVKNVKKIKVISRAHRYDLYEEENKLNYLPMRKYLLNNLDSVYCCSEHGAKYLEKKYPNYSNKIHCSYLGTDDFGFDDKIGNNKLEIISCSTLNPVKQVDFIAKVVCELSKKINLHWTHIGGNDSQLKPMKEEYQKLIKNNVITFKGSLNHDEVVNLYKNEHYDLFINLSKSEGIPQAIMEAISFGIPTVATNVGGTSEIVLNNVSGLLVNETDNIDEVCAKIIYFYKMGEKEKFELRHKTRNFWNENFNVKNNIQKFLTEIRM